MPDDAPPPEPPKPRTEKVKDISLPSAVLALDATADGATIYAACLDGSVQVVNAESGQAEVLGRHDSYASAVALMPDGNTLISGGYDGCLLWHDLAERKVVRRIEAHDFWVWDMALSRNGRVLASVTGRYEAGGYKYEPAPEREPSVKVFDAATGELLRSLPHVPPVQAVALTPDGEHVAAGNLMGEIRVWNVASGDAVAQWTTDDFTSWGIIKSHHYLGGVFDMTFGLDGTDLYACGMGPMRDPMAGNGVQRWQRFNWRTGEKLGESREDESGRGLMESLAFHPTQPFFFMGGRLVNGNWNMALFDAGSGRNVFSLDAKHRITDACFTADGTRLLLGKATSQERRKDGQWPDFGLVEIHRLQTT